MKKSTVLLIAVLLVVFNAAAWKELRADERTDGEYTAAQMAGCSVVTKVIMNVVGTDLGLDLYVKTSKMSDFFLKNYKLYVSIDQPNYNFYMKKAIEKVEKSAGDNDALVKQFNYCEKLYDAIA